MAKKKRKKRSNGEGSPVQLPDGRWKMTVTIGRGPDGRQIRRSKRCASQADAIAFRNKTLAEFVAVPTAAADSAISLTHYLTSWLKDKEQHTSPRTHEAYEWIVENYIVPGIGKTLLRELTAKEIRKWIGVLYEGGLSGTRTLQQCYDVLSRALNAAAKDGDIPGNPCRQVERPKYEREKIDPFTREESLKILKHTNGHRLHGLFVLAFTAGLRTGELFGMHWSDVDLKAGTLRIERQAIEKRGKTIIKSPKSKRSRRTIRLTKRAVKALEDRRTVALKEGLAACEIVFPAPRGNYNRRSTFRARVWEPLLAREELKIRHRGMHHCRHTFATLLLGSGEPVHVVSEILGHSDVATTLRLYAHAIPDQQKQAAATAQKLFG